MRSLPFTFGMSTAVHPARTWSAPAGPPPRLNLEFMTLY